MSTATLTLPTEVATETLSGRILTEQLARAANILKPLARTSKHLIAGDYTILRSDRGWMAIDVVAPYLEWTATARIGAMILAEGVAAASHRLLFDVAPLLETQAINFSLDETANLVLETGRRTMRFHKPNPRVLDLSHVLPPVTAKGEKVQIAELPGGLPKPVVTAIKRATKTNRRYIALITMAEDERVITLRIENAITTTITVAKTAMAK